MPRLQGRLVAAELGLVINKADPYSVAVGAYYAKHRGLRPDQVLEVELPPRPQLSAEDFARLRQQIQDRLPEAQALALAWTQPYAVGCQSINGALALGLDADLCQRSCAPSPPSAYPRYLGRRPASDLGLLPSMLLAARSVASAQALIDRGIAADHSGGGPGAPAQAVFVRTADRARNVRAASFPPPGPLQPANVLVRVESAPVGMLDDVLLYQTGLPRVAGLELITWRPGALADHLTSFGGQLLRELEGPQMSALDWLEAGATASYGTVSEPCNHWQKFPHPQLLLLNYLQGASALEAYWRSVLWPSQGVFIGEPLAAPYAIRRLASPW